MLQHFVRARAAPAAGLVVCLAFGCAPTARIALDTAVPVTGIPPDAVPLEVMTRASAVRDPLPLAGARTSVSGLEEALGHAVSTAVVPWAQRHRGERPDGWQLTVELTQADASEHAGRVAVTLAVRATLRTRVGRQYLAQTQAHCRQALLVSAAQSAPVFYACMMNIGRDLGGWLGGVQP